MDLETVSAAVVRWDLVVLGLADMHDMMGHCSWLENVDLVDHQLVTLNEVPGQRELELHVRPDPGMGQENYGQ